MAHRGAAGSDSLAHPLSPLSAADSASGAGDDPGSRAGVLGQAVASALGICGSPWLRTHDRWPPFPCRGERKCPQRDEGSSGGGDLDHSYPPVLPRSTWFTSALHLPMLRRPWGAQEAWLCWLPFCRYQPWTSPTPGFLCPQAQCILPPETCPSTLTLAPAYPHSLVS